MPTNNNISRLKAAINRLQSTAADLEAEIIDLEHDLESFTQRYMRLIQPKLDRIDIITHMIRDLENELADRNAAHTQTPPATWTPPSDYVSVEEQFRRTWQTSPQPNYGSQTANAAARTPPPPQPSPEQIDLKRLYRQLVKRYHPDLTTDPHERARRNRLMAEINAAYAEGDVDALQALAAQSDAPSIDEPLAAIELRQFQQIHQQLTDRIAYLQQQRHDLMNGDLMAHKLQASFAAREGRDYLQDMADRLDAEYAALLDRLDDLKRRY